MKFIRKRKVPKFNDQEWHTWFAWYPIKHHEYVYEIIIWLQFIERRWVLPISSDGYWEYRLPVSKNLVFRAKYV
jgi:hypothetical protein